MGGRGGSPRWEEEEAARDGRKRRQPAMGGRGGSPRWEEEEAARDGRKRRQPAMGGNGRRNGNGRKAGNGQASQAAFASASGKTRNPSGKALRGKLATLSWKTSRSGRTPPSTRLSTANRRWDPPADPQHISGYIGGLGVVRGQVGAVQTRFRVGTPPGVERPAVPAALLTARGRHRGCGVWRGPDASPA